MAARTDVYTRPRSQTRLFVASAVWAAGIIPLAWLSSSFLSIPGAFGAGYFWLPQILMVSGAVFFGPWGMVAAAVGTFFGGMLAGSALAINIAQNPIPAFLGNTLLLYWLWFGFDIKFFGFDIRWNGFRIKVDKEERVDTERPGWGVAASIIAVTIIFAVVLGFFIGPALGKWGYAVVFLATLPSWAFLNRLGYNIPLDRNIALGLLAVVVSSVASAAMGGLAWQTIGGMGVSAWVIVFPGWGLGDIVAGSFSIPLIWSFARTMERRGLLWRPLN